jgi:hypothetical protein
MAVAKSSNSDKRRTNGMTMIKQSIDCIDESSVSQGKFKGGRERIQFSFSTVAGYNEEKMVSKLNQMGPRRSETSSFAISAKLPNENGLWERTQ